MVIFTKKTRREAEELNNQQDEAAAWISSLAMLTGRIVQNQLRGTVSQVGRNMGLNRLRSRESQAVILPAKTVA